MYLLLRQFVFVFSKKLYNRKCSHCSFYNSKVQKPKQKQVFTFVLGYKRVIEIHPYSEHVLTREDVHYIVYKQVSVKVILLRPYCMFDVQ